jgi:hypothetical protein
MTALEIAHQLEQIFGDYTDEASTMLRKQDAQIKLLREALMGCMAAGSISKHMAEKALAATGEFK